MELAGQIGLELAGQIGLEFARVSRLTTIPLASLPYTGSHKKSLFIFTEVQGAPSLHHKRMLTIHHTPYTIQSVGACSHTIHHAMSTIHHANCTTDYCVVALSIWTNRHHICDGHSLQWALSTCRAQLQVCSRIRDPHDDQACPCPVAEGCATSLNRRTMDIESKILGLLPLEAPPSMPSALRRWTGYSGCLAPRRDVPTDQQPSLDTCLVWCCTELF